MAKDESKSQWLVLFTVIFGTFLGGLNQSVANLSLPKIIQDFGISVSTAAWISTAYIIANAVLVPVWGKLGDKVGRKKVYLAGFSIFAFGSLLVGLAWNFSSMIVFRVIQAIAVSADYPTAMAIIAVTFIDGKKRAQAMGIWSASFAMASILGPLIGGPIMDTFGWRAIFFVMVPLSLCGIILATLFIKESVVHSNKKYKFDFLGSIVFGFVISALILVLDKGTEWGWTSTNSLIAYGVIVVFGYIFYLSETTHEDPVIDFRFFKNKVFVLTLFNNMIISMGLMGVVFIISIFVQGYLGYSATETGFMYIPMAVFMMIFSQMGGRLIGKVEARYIIFVSTFVGACGMLLFSFLIDPKSGPLDIIIPLSFLAGGLGFAMAQRTSLVASSVAHNEVGIASSILSLGRNVAGALGIAIFSTVLTNSTENHVLDLAQNSMINLQSPEVYSNVAALIAVKAQVMAFSTVFLVSAVIVFIGAFFALLIKPKKAEELGTVGFE